MRQFASSEELFVRNSDFQVQETRSVFQPRTTKRIPPPWMRVCNPDRLPVGIHAWDGAQLHRHTRTDKTGVSDDLWSPDELTRSACLASLCQSRGRDIQVPE